MSQTSIEQLAHRVAALERAGRFSVYSGFYAATALMSATVSCLPLLDDVVTGDLTVTYGTLWQMADRPGGGPAVAGILLVLGLVVLLVMAAIRVQTQGLPLAIALDSATIGVMLITRPGAGTPRPGLSEGGWVALVLASCTLAVSIVHAVQLHGESRVPPAGKQDFTPF